MVLHRANEGQHGPAALRASAELSAAGSFGADWYVVDVWCAPASPTCTEHAV